MKALSRIDEIVEEFKSSGDFSRAEFDELVMLVDIAKDTLPKRFAQIVGQTDQKFPAGSTGVKRDERFEIAERLETVLRVANEFPSQTSETAGNDEDELTPTFILDPSDKTRVLDLCAQMRKIVLATDVFDQPHKRRLLNRIAGIEHQVEQPKGLLDVIRAGVSDVGETLGKFGTDIEPLTKRMQEVAQIARSNSKEYKQIPAPEEVKQLPKPEEDT
ncbi:hypothetical protein [Phaeobacter italicus]|uniref:hypothetical protein n=1 Tax=Phaeobacter italicus TaxID=481446 RepID=UPI00248E9463|nr:hypothetical protein [Phaeobacter italicus]